MKELLNHGHIHLVESMGSDMLVFTSARVSYDGKGKSTDAGLISYLLRNGHTSPFESCAATFQVKAPIFVFRQWHRHRTQSFNEISARYTELPDEFYVPELSQITTQHTDNKQMRTTTQHPKADVIQNVIQQVCQSAFRDYKRMLHEGCPRELARGVLPVNTYSKMYASANLHNWLRFLTLRLHEHAQYEIRVYAEAIKEALTPLFPMTFAAFKEIQNNE